MQQPFAYSGPFMPSFSGPVTDVPSYGSYFGGQVPGEQPRSSYGGSPTVVGSTSISPPGSPPQVRGLSHPPDMARPLSQHPPFPTTQESGAELSTTKEDGQLHEMS
jgi:hypothetical protein